MRNFRMVVLILGILVAGLAINSVANAATPSGSSKEETYRHDKDKNKNKHKNKHKDKPDNKLHKDKHKDKPHKQKNKPEKIKDKM